MCSREDNPPPGDSVPGDTNWPSAAGAVTGSCQHYGPEDLGVSPEEFYKLSFFETVQPFRPMGAPPGPRCQGPSGPSDE